MKKVRSSQYEHRQADWYAGYALSAKNNGELGRAVTLYEHALNFELEAINAYGGETSSTEVLGYYRNAISYALQCGRRNKAKHLIEAARTLNLLAETAAEFESLLDSL